MSDPCGNEECDKCYPIPRWTVSQHRVQHITYRREIKAATAEEALRIFEAGTAWPSQYDDDYGDIVQLDDVKTEQLPPSDLPQMYTCYHDLEKLP